MSNDKIEQFLEKQLEKTQEQLEAKDIFWRDEMERRETSVIAIYEAQIELLKSIIEDLTSEPESNTGSFAALAENLDPEEVKKRVAEDVARHEKMLDRLKGKRETFVMKLNPPQKAEVEDEDESEVA